MTAVEHGTPVRRHRLDNGLRVVLPPAWDTPRVAVSVHYGVGFRSERPGEEGLAHLFEHLMFRGSVSLPDGRFFEALHPIAGTANGTTHQDYTDYYQLAPAQALEQALFREADRMRAPRFTPTELSAQLTEVVREIRHAMQGRAYGGFPWPMLPAVLFESFANAHDGYGAPERLRDTTVRDCARFFDRHYAPGNAVLTVVGPYDPETVLELVRRHFDDIPARRATPSPDVAEPAPTVPRLVVCTAPGIRRAAVAAAYRLPDARTALPAYLAYMVLAELTAGPARSGGAVGAGCGFFGPLDAAGPDALVLTTLLPAATRPEVLPQELATWWAGHADARSVAAAAERAMRSLSARHRREHADLVRRCRAYGRFELLFGRPDLVTELPALFESGEPEHVASAAASLAAAHPAVLVVEPGPERTYPVMAPVVPDAESPAPLRWPTGSSRPFPAAGEPAAPSLHGATDAVLPTGLRTSTVPDHRAGLLELRLRLPLGPKGWRRPREVACMLRRLELAVDAPGRIAVLGGELRLSTDGQWADVAGWVPVGQRGGLLRVLADLLDPTRIGDGPAGAGPGLLRRSPERRMDEALRRHWLGGDEPADELDPVVLHRAVLDPRGAVLVAVGPVDADRWAAETTRALSSWTGHGPPSAGVTVAAPGVLTVPAPGMDAVHLTLCAAEPSGGPHDPSRYLATAVLGGHLDARLARRCRRLRRADHVMFAGRDIVADRARALVRLAVPRPFLARAVDDVAAEAAALAAVPPGRAEMDAVRRYCAAQLLSAFDSPGVLADALRHTAAAGRDLDWVVRRAGVLATVTGEMVAEAARDLFATLPETVVALGDVDRDDIVRELSGRA